MTRTTIMVATMTMAEPRPGGSRINNLADRKAAFTESAKLLSVREIFLYIYFVP